MTSKLVKHDLDFSQNAPTITSEYTKALKQLEGRVDSVDSLTPTIQEISNSLFKVKNLTKLLDKLHISDKGLKLSEGEPTQEDLEEVLTNSNFIVRPSDLFLKIYFEVVRTLEKDPLAGLVSPSLLSGSGVIPLTIISVIPDIIQHYANVIVETEHELFLATNFWESSNEAESISNALRELSRRAGERGTKVVVKMMYDRGNLKQVEKSHQFVDEKTWTGERVRLPALDEIPNLHFELINYHVPPVGTFHAKYMISDRRIALLNSNNIQTRVNLEMMTHIEGPIVQSFYDMALLSWNEKMTPPLPLLLNPLPPQTNFDFSTDHPHIKNKDLEGSKIHSRNLLNDHHLYADENQNPKSKSDTVPTSSNTNENLGAVPVNNLASSATYDINNQAEADRVQATLSTQDSVTQHLNTGTPIEGNEPRDNEADEFRPHILHQRHDPFPIALVNRRPHGTPGHSDSVNPQDAAFLAGFKYATKKVFIQTPTFNASLVVDAAIEAVKRGIEVTIFADLGFNDEGELLPFQGGTNEMVAREMYKRLNEEEKNFLRIYWYTGKDQNKPLNAKDKSRSCHVKLMIVDSQVGIQGNGNQDVQSWFHSQEVNQMIDSASVCKEWEAGIESNQNTHLHGELDKDGIWRRDGKPLPSATGGPHGPFKSLAGVKGAIQRVRGEGGF